MRLVTALYPVPIMVHTCVEVLTLLATRDRYPVVFLGAALAARAAMLAFLGLFAVVVLFRLPPLAKSSGARPRLIALAGTGSPALLTLLPRNPDSLEVNIASSLLVALGFGLTGYCLAHLDRATSIMPEARRLVTSGPYRLVRHPMYLCEQIGLFGVALPYLSPWLTPLLAVQMALQLQRMRHEERVLGTSFPAYADYARRTRRVLPGLY